MKKDAKNVNLLRNASNVFMAIITLIGIGSIFSGLAGGSLESIYISIGGLLIIVVGALFYALALNIANINQNLDDIRWYKQHEYNKEKEEE